VVFSKKPFFEKPIRKELARNKKSKEDQKKIFFLNKGNKGCDEDKIKKRNKEQGGEIYFKKGTVK